MLLDYDVPLQGQPGIWKGTATSPESVSVADKMVELYLRSLTILLPSPENPFSVDNEPPRIIEILMRSPLLVKTAELLRNDSIEDATVRCGLYDALFAFLEVLGSHPATSPTIHDEMVVYKPKEQLPQISFSDQPSSLTRHFLRSSKKTAMEDGDQANKTKSLLHLLQGLESQCKRIKGRASAHKADFATAGGKSMLQFCDRVSSLVSCLELNQVRFGKTRHRGDQGLGDIFKGRTRARITESSLEEWHRDHCVDEVPDKELAKSFAIVKQAQSEAKGRPASGRMKRLISEITMMSRSLPQGIYVRHGSSRLDMLKALIIGPQRTPYENGVFEFDLLCPLNYPQVPPKVIFKTTGNGKVRFNPNLYPTGQGRSCHRKARDPHDLGLWLFADGFSKQQSACHCWELGAANLGIQISRPSCKFSSPCRR